MGGGLTFEPAMVLDSWLWSLEHTHLRVFVALVGLASSAPTIHRSPIWGEVPIPACGLVTSLDRLADRVGVSRSVVRSALQRLAAGPNRDGRDPAIELATNPRGYTVITVSILGTSVGVAQDGYAVSGGVISPDRTGAQPPIAQGHSAESHSRQHSEKRDSTATSTADRTASVDDNPRSHQQMQGQGDLEAHSGQHNESHASDPESSRERSSDLISVPKNEDLENHSATDSGPTDSDPKRLKAERIPERAWKGADFLRAQILEAFPDNIVRKQPWGPDVQRGWRLTWADEIRLMHERDGRSYEDIGRTIRWLFQGQTAEPRFRIVVFSADALRTKWDQIHVAIKRQAEQEATPRRNPNQPNRSAPTPKEWK